MQPPPKEATEPVAWWSDGTITKSLKEYGKYQKIVDRKHNAHMLQIKYFFWFSLLFCVNLAICLILQGS